MGRSSAGEQRDNEDIFVKGIWFASTGAGSHTMVITGVDRLHPTEHRVIGDRIVAATWGIAAAMTRGDISVTGVDPQHLQLVLHKLHDAGATVTQDDNGFRIVQYERPKAVNVATV